ncbi:LacI family transcriptional regulator [Pseudooceanicola sp. CBS1P-1]|uniref:Substrate-binding domain-containing protein n=1 Tax=Pseudooceanicola albus TaxID=2692189 RepID=A0A6L7G5V2_9RHOB|nr:MULTISPECIES: LacI family DNA-binding transcriptional regulator [Pseudooceanicola]MBT9386152.1 LacI family transcriptional regulator [Pseudooceanicola endophyticus]MXN19431.1 substrate-binding domain-containing protein [Pseudooceanicola albus]
MTARNKKLTVADVARAAKVSKATAARVLGGYGVTSERTREAVLQAAQDLGYRPNELARSVSTGRSGLIGVVVGDIENAFFARAVRGISDTARAAGLNVIISNSGEDLAQERALVSVLLRQQVQGLIVAPTDDGDVAHLAEAMASGTPVVTIDRWVEGLGADGICGDDRAATAALVAQMQALGHRRIAYVTAIRTPQPRLQSLAQVRIAAVRERIAGFLSAAPAGQDWHERVHTNATGAAAIDAIVARLLSETPGVTAILASDSLVGAEVFRALSARGIALPAQMSLVAWFDADWSRVTVPAVTVVDQPTHRFGALAAERIIARIGGETGPARHQRIETPLIRRGSLGPAPGD